MATVTDRMEVHKQTADVFMQHAMNTGCLFEEGTVLEKETKADVKNPDAIIAYLEKVGAIRKNHLEFYKVLNSIEEGPVNEILTQLGQSLAETDEKFLPVITNFLYQRVFLIEMRGVQDLYEIAVKKIQAIHENPKGKEEAETARRALDDRYSRISRLKDACGIKISDEDYEILKIADEQIALLFNKLSEKPGSPIEEPVEAKPVSPSSTPIDPVLVKDEEVPLKPRYHETTPTTPMEILQNSDTEEDEPKEEIVTPDVINNDRTTPYENETPLEAAMSKIYRLEQIAKGQQKTVDKAEVKAALALPIDELNTLYGLVYQIAKEKNPNDVRLKEWGFGEKYVASDIEILQKALNELHNKQLAKTA